MASTVQPIRCVVANAEIPWARHPLIEALTIGVSSLQIRGLQVFHHHTIPFQALTLAFTNTTEVCRVQSSSVLSIVHSYCDPEHH